MRQLFKLDGGNKRNIKNNQKIIVENQNTDLNSLREIISQSVISSTVSDVDIGLLLSSGLDSNILLYELLEKGIEVNPIIGFKSHEEFMKLN